MDVRLRRISSLLGWTFELALALPISRRRFESRLVGLSAGFGPTAVQVTAVFKG